MRQYFLIFWFVSTSNFFNFWILSIFSFLILLIFSNFLFKQRRRGAGGSEAEGGRIFLIFFEFFTFQTVLDFDIFWNFSKGAGWRVSSGGRQGEGGAFFRIFYFNFFPFFKFKNDGVVREGEWGVVTRAAERGCEVFFHFFEFFIWNFFDFLKFFAFFNFLIFLLFRFYSLKIFPLQIIFHVLVFLIFCFFEFFIRKIFPIPTIFFEVFFTSNFLNFIFFKYFEFLFF